MDLTVVVSVRNEEDALPAFIERARSVLDDLDREAEFLFVNDGRRDASATVVARAAAADHRIRLLNLARNFGHEAAMIAGIDRARGAAVICMDADLQHLRGGEAAPDLHRRRDRGARCSLEDSPAASTGSSTTYSHQSSATRAPS